MRISIISGQNISIHLPSDQQKQDAPKFISRNPKKTKNTLEAIQKFVAIQIVVLGALQSMALKFPKEVINKTYCWMRTPPEGIPSEFITKISLVYIINSKLRGLCKKFDNANNS